MKTAGTRLWTVAFLSLGMGCESPEAPDPVPGSPGWREAQRILVEEAVYRQQFTEHAPGATAGSVTFCLARTTETEELPWTDPPESLLRRFATHSPSVKKVSLCELDLRGDRDPATGRPAIIFRVAPLSWLSDTEVDLNGGYHQNGLSASGQTYQVRYANGRWTVTEVVWRWIS